MFSRSNQARVIITCLVSMAVSACAGGPTLPPPGVTTAPITTAASTALTLVDPLGDEAAKGLTGSSLVPSKLPSVYTRLARGLNRCWLKDGRPLGREYVLYAKVDPAPASNGTISIHFRSPTGRKALKAYQIDLIGAGEQTRVTTTNLKLLPRESKAISRDVERWALSGADCSTRKAHVPPPGRRPGRAKPRGQAF